MKNSDYLKVAVSAARESAKTFTRYFGHAGKVSLKDNDPRNLVTKIDKQIEMQIRSLLLKHFPKHKIIGEEFGSEKLNKNDLVWIIDPIDGTTNYIQGMPFCCISIGLWDNSGPLVGVVYNPVMGYLFTAKRGSGAFLNGKKIKVSGKNSLKFGFGGFGWGRNLDRAGVNFPKLIGLLHKVRTLGSCTFEMCLCAMGVFDFHIQTGLSLWDFAAVACIVREAGGKITELDGKKINHATKAVIASNGKIHNQLIRDFQKSVFIS